MGSIDRRIEALEKAYGESPREEDPAEVARWREELKAGLERAYEKAGREEREGHPQRRVALDNLVRSLRARIAARRL
jgi:hypothetical protein